MFDRGTDHPHVPSVFFVDDMPGYPVERVPPPTDARAELDRLVRETKAESATAAQDTKWGAPESSSFVGLPYRSSCVSHLLPIENFTYHVT
jgi:hypothetical protein